MDRLKDKVAIVTGCADGLGLKTVKMFLEEGAKVVGTDIQEELLMSRVEEINSDDCLLIKQDVTSPEDWENVAKQTLDKFGKLDILVNNAGYVVAKSIIDETLEEWHKVMEVNATGCFLGIKTCYPVMGVDGHSSIINLSSAAGVVGGPRTGNDAAYNAAKAAVRLLTKHCAHALADRNIRVNSVHPGGIATPMFKEYVSAHPEMLDDIKGYSPLYPHVAEPEDIAYGIIYLASDESRCVTGSELAVDNGYTAF